MILKRRLAENKLPRFFPDRASCSCSIAATRTELVPDCRPPLPQWHHCRCHRHSVRDERRSCKSQLLHFSPFLLPFPQDIYLLTFFFHFAFCFKHGRVNLLILQAASHSIYLSSCVSPLSLSGRAVLSGPSRAAGLSGVMDDYQPSAVFHYAPGRFTGSLTTRHENQSLFLILPSLPPSTPASLLPSHTLHFNISSVTKKQKKNLS